MPQQLLDDAARTRLSRRLAEFEVGGVSGTVLLAEAGIPVVQHCLGLADRACGTPITAATRFQTASVTCCAGQEWTTAGSIAPTSRGRGLQCTTYLPSGRTNVHSVPVVGGGDGGCVCTAADLVRFCRALADGTLLGELTALATQRHATIGDDWCYGYGLMIYPDGRRGHGGSDPGVSTAVNHWPAPDLTVVALCNVEDTDEMDPAFALRDAVLAATGLAPE